VRRVIKGYDTPSPKQSKYENLLEIVKEIMSRCRGNLVRVQECLSEEHGISIPYTSLTWMVRYYQLKEAPKKRSGQYVLHPGEEMQHDTSPYKIELGSKKVIAQCAGLALAYSRRVYIQFYPRFTRFEAKVFLSNGFEFMQGVCPRCVVDNTSVIVRQGTGPDAIIAPEMEAFGRLYQVVFVPHRVKDPNRKARIERPFDYVFKNFLSGRSFSSWDDLNSQALSWCKDVANTKTKRSLGMSPEQAYLMEKSYLVPLPVHVPDVYYLKNRVVDSEAYVHIESNRYSVPEKLVGQKVEVYVFWDKIQVFARHQKMAEHARVRECKQARITDPNHHPPIRKKNNGPCREEQLLTGNSQVLDDYVAELKKQFRGRGVQSLRRLLALKREYPEEPFNKAIERALHFKVYNLARLENLILDFIQGEFFEL